MHLLGEIFKDERISRHMVQLGIVLAALFLAICGAVAVGWRLQQSGSVSDTSLPSTTTPAELTFQEKMRTLNAMNEMTATTTISRSAAATSTSGGAVMPGSTDTVAPANDPRTKTLDSLAARHAAGSGVGTASSTGGTSNSGLSAEEKMKLLNSIQKQ
jgi:hypothetical protein